MEHQLNGVERTFPRKKAGGMKPKPKQKPKKPQKKPKGVDMRLAPVTGEPFETAGTVQKKRKKGSKTRQRKRAAAFEAKIAAKKAAVAERMLKETSGLPEGPTEGKEDDEDGEDVNSENVGKAQGSSGYRKRKMHEEEEETSDEEETGEEGMGKEETSDMEEDGEEDVGDGEGGKGAREENEEDESAAFRKEIANMPMGKVKELKEKLGIKLFNKAFFGKSSKKSTANKEAPENQSRTFVRENPKRPREMSSKRPVSKFRNIYANERIEKERFDPRFDDRCGEFDEFIHRSNYAFLDDMRLGERKMLEKEIQKMKREDPEKAEKMKESLRRMKNRERATAEKDRNKEVLRQLRRENNERLRRGEKPVFLKRSEVKMRMMEKKYEELKKTNSLDHYLERKAKKQNRKGGGAAV